MRVNTLSIIGVGLIGGSIGLAAKARNCAARVVGIGRNVAKLARARELGAIDDYTTDLAAGVANADLVVVCTPVDRIADDVLEVARFAPSSAIITDAGSTKGNILAALAGKLNGARFVGSHPLAGSEKQGVESALPELFEKRVVILTPTPGSDPDAVVALDHFWSAMGARVVTIDPAEHDRILATTSHLPHAVAAAVAKRTPAEWLVYSAGGFRDTTRIAGGDPDLWTAIFQANREAVGEALAQLIGELETFRKLLNADDHAGMVEWLAKAKQVRDALGNRD